MMDKGANPPLMNMMNLVGALIPVTSTLDSKTAMLSGNLDARALMVWIQKSMGC
jgi:hypothetical protein